ncbi:DUF6443 domain-containing protein [Chryseolinea soli]|uniref:DUF6443 domain-containing protein n=1 Tax=Chryseolinea soli TaxID=2321403 RepID=A0A385SP19_9BACT|nr:DUF6443 domain-containing protein [Chryseolinea soli]AYB33473.1 hypothetical protein D4L85_24070 [Chryseolinea soli]
MRNKIVFLFILLLAAAHQLVAGPNATLGYSGGLCAGAQVDIFINGTGTDCGAPLVTQTSSWYFSRPPSSVTYETLTANNYYKVHATWNTSGAVQVYVNYSCGPGQGSSGSSDRLDLNIISAVTPSVTLATNNPAICQNAGTIVRLTPTPTNGGTNPTYAWYVDNTLVYTGMETYYDYNTVNLSPGSHNAKVVMTSKFACLTVNPTPPSTITPADTFYVTRRKIMGANFFANGQICASDPNRVQNASVSVSSAVGNIQYRWLYNGSPGAYTTSNTHAYTGVTAGSYIQVEVTSDAWCTNAQTGAPLLAPLPNPYYINVTNGTTPTIDIVIPTGKKNYCPGETITLTSSQPASTYTWKNGTTTLGTTQSINIVVSSDPNAPATQFTSGDVISLDVTGLTSGGACLSTTSASNTTTPLAIVVNPLPNVTTTPASGNVRFCSNCWPPLSVPSAANTTYQWFKDGAPLQYGTGNTYSAHLAGAYTVTATALCTSTSLPVTLIRNTFPVADAGVDKSVALPLASLVVTGTASEPDTDGNIASMSWSQVSGPTVTMNSSASGTGTRNATSTLTLTNLVAGNYVFRLKATDNLTDYAIDDVNVFIAPPNNYNYVRTETLTTPVTAAAAVVPLSIGNRLESTEYYDGLGRPMQSVITQGSASKDIVTPRVYDQFGREALLYLPYKSSSTNGDYQVNPVGTTNANYTSSPQYVFYNALGDNIVDDQRPFSEIKFDGSLDRPSKEYRPGKAWAPTSSGGNNKFIKRDLFVNVHSVTGSATAEKVICWRVSRTGVITREIPSAGVIETGGYYSSNQLTIASTLDEHGNAVREYFNRNGQRVLRKVQVYGSTSANLNDVKQWTFTYFLYDDYSNLRYIFQPMLSIVLHQNDTVLPAQSDIQKWAYYYIYDGRGRMIEKWVPGAEPVYLAYDPRDRLVMIQDGVQRAKSPREWTVIKYDANNRPIITALLPDPYGWTRSFVQDYINNYYNNLASGKAWYEERGNDMHGYTNKSFPDQLLSTECLTVTYYDDYAFKNAIRKPSDYAYLSSDIVGLPSIAQQFVKGLVTGTKVRVLDGEVFGEVQWLTSYQYYDDKYRLVQTVSDNYKGGKDRISSLYDFANLLKTKTTHQSRVITWTSSLNTSMEGNKVVKSGGLSDNWDASATSIETLSANTSGFLEITASEEWTYRMFGLATQNPNGNPALVNYGLLLQAGGNLVKAESGTYTSIGTYCSGDTLRIERSGGQIIYKLNGATLGSPTSGSTTALNAVALFYSQNSSIAYAKSSFGSSAMVINREIEYDLLQRPTNLWHQVNNNTKYVISHFNYNDLGQVTEKRLHSTNATATDAKESIDYRYNIRGWLISINDPVLNPRLFAEVLKTYDPTVNGGTAQYNGNISEVIWRNGGSFKQSYGYYYDTLNQLKDARYFNLDVAGQNDRYRETIGGVNAKGYDLNGNILKLTRNGKNGSNSFGLMDNLAYSYVGNQLVKVDDAMVLNSQEQGFKELVKQATEYSYDQNGSMSADANKGVSSMAYNYMNLPRKVIKSSTDYITYVYDASGRKLFQQMFGTTGSRRTDYAGQFIYQNDSLKFATHEEGRAVLTTSTPEYQYELKDHLGNVRLTFTTLQSSETVTGTLETANATADQSNFLRYESVRKVQSSLFDHTNGTAIGYAQRLNGSANEKYGLARSLSVMPGDVINMEVFAKYIDTNSTNRTAALNTLLAQIAAGTAPAGTVVDGGSYASSTSSFPFAGLLNTSGSTGGPKAYLNYLIFDRNYNFKSGGFKRISTTPKETGGDVAHERLFFDNISVNEAGYVYIYLSNEETSPVEVYFDDFKVTQTKSAIVQQDDYYPFGLAFNSFRRENSMKQDYKFNGKELQDELAINWLDYGARMNMPEVGRWTATDPLADFFPSLSPYSFAYNNPVRFIDFFGLSSEDVNGGGPNSLSPTGGSSPRSGSDSGGADSGSSGASSGSGNNSGSEVPSAGSSQTINGCLCASNAPSFGPNPTVVQIHPEIPQSDKWATTKAAVPFAITLSAADGPIPIGELAGAALMSGAIAYDLVRNMNEEAFYYATYIKVNPTTGKVYVGRTSGYGTPSSIVADRDKNHKALDDKGFGKAIPSTWQKAYVPGGYKMRAGDPAYWAIRGSEQLQIEYFRSKGISGNEYNGVGPNNDKLNKYMETVKKFFDSMKFEL